MKAEVIASPAPNPEAPNHFVLARVDTSGAFRLPGLRPGTTRLHLLGIQTNFSALRRRVERDGVVVDDPLRLPPGIDVKPGESVSGVRIVISYGSGVIRGKLNVVGGELSPAASVQFSLRVFEPSLGRYILSGVPSISTNWFQFENLVAGQYEVRASVLLDSTSPPRRDNVMVRSQRVTLSNDKTEEITMELDLRSKPGQ